MGYVDVEVLLVAYLKAKTGKRVLTDLPADLAEILPLHRLTRVSGADNDYRLDQSVVNVDTFAADRAQAYTLANAVRDVLRNDLPTVDAVRPTGVVTAVRTIVAPRWLPDSNPNLRRVQASYEVITHP